MLVTLEDLAARLDNLHAALADYKNGQDRSLRTFAQDEIAEMLGDIRETAACEAAIAPAKRDELAALIRDPELRAASGVPEAQYNGPPLNPTERRRRRKPHGGLRPYIPPPAGE